MGERNYYKIDGRVLSTPSQDLSSEEKIAEEKNVKAFMEKIFNNGRDSVFGELIKKDEERIMIKDFDKYIRAEAISLGVEDLRQPLPGRRIHFALPGGYHKQFPHLRQTAGGNYDSFSDAIYIKKDKDMNRWKIAHIALHEMIHAYSAIRYDLDAAGELNSAKLGYNTTGIKSGAEKSSGEPETELEVSQLFLGFNEAITDLMAQEILDKHQADLSQNLNISAEEINASPLKRYGYCAAVEWLLVKIAEKNNEDKSVVWNKFKLGMLTGQIMHLREIEKTLGAGALRLFANMGNSKEANLAVGAFMSNYDINN